MSRPEQVRQITSALPVATGPRQTKKGVRAAMREVYGPEWFKNGTTKGVYKRVLAAHAARNK
jgi:hypothetical protein